MSKRPTVPTDAELIADALNEQGYLLQLRLLSLINTVQQGEDFPPWRIEAAEYPVSTANGKQTRIDIVLAHKTLPNVCLALECKRANPLYKRWVFFASTVRPHEFFFDTARQFSKGPDGRFQYIRGLDAVPASTEAYTFYLEALQERLRSQKRSSATNAIEDAFQQISTGQVGLMRKLILFGETMPGLPPPPIRVIPVVVTTAQLFAANFGHDAIPLATGEITPDKLVLTKPKYLAVNFRLNDDLAEFAGLTSQKPARIGLDLTTQQVRTVFVVQASHFREFLFWADEKIVEL